MPSNIAGTVFLRELERRQRNAEVEEAKTREWSDRAYQGMQELGKQQEADFQRNITMAQMMGKVAALAQQQDPMYEDPHSQQAALMGKYEGQAMLDKMAQEREKHQNKLLLDYQRAMLQDQRFQVGEERRDKQFAELQAGRAADRTERGKQHKERMDLGRAGLGLRKDVEARRATQQQDFTLQRAVDSIGRQSQSKKFSAYKPAQVKAVLDLNMAYTAAQKLGDPKLIESAREQLQAFVQQQFPEHLQAAQQQAQVPQVASPIDLGGGGEDFGGDDAAEVDEFLRPRNP